MSGLTTINVNDASSPIDGATGHDVLRFSGPTGSTGYKVVINEDTDGSFSGDVEILGKNITKTFSGIEDFAFETFINGGARNNDVVDATGVSSGLTLDTGIGDDTVDFGAGDDTFSLGNKRHGHDVVDGGAGHDTLDLLSDVGGNLAGQYTISGTNIHDTKKLVAQSVNQPGNSVSFGNFEVIKAGTLADVFTGGYAARSLKTIDMANGNDVFDWLVFDGDDLNIDAGSRDDLVKIGANPGSGFSGLLNGEVEGGAGHDTLRIGTTNGNQGATGFNVVIADDTDEANAFAGTVAYEGVADSPVAAFSGFETITFSTFKSAKNENDVVDATGATDLTLDTGIGDDTVDFGTGDDTFVIGKREFGADVVDGGAGHDTLDLSAVTGAGRSPFTFSGTNLFQTKDYRVERTDNATHSVTFTDFEAIKSGGGDDVFTNGYAAETLKSVEMGAGNDVFGWLTFNGTEMDIDAGRGNDTVAIGGNAGSGRTGLIDGAVDGGIGTDTLALRDTNGHFGATGFKVVITDDTDRNAFEGTVAYTDGLGGVDVAFDSIEAFSFTGRVAATSNDHVDATLATNDLVLDTGAGNDTVNFGSGDDTFVISSRKFGADVTDGGAGHDTLDLSAVTGAGRADFSFVGVGTFANNSIPLQVFANGSNNIAFDNFEAIISGGGNDVFGGRVSETTTGNAFADETLKYIDMGAGNDVFAWNYTGGTLDIDGGRGNDTVKLGDLAGNGAVSLLNGTVDGGDGADTLEFGFLRSVNGNGFKVIFDGDGSGDVGYDHASAAFVGATQFDSIETLVFEGDTRFATDDIVDISASRTNLTVDTGAGDDIIIGGNGGKDHLTGGAGADQFVFETDGSFGKDKITDFDVAEGDQLVGLTGVSDADITQRGDWVQIRADNGVLLIQDAVEAEIETYFTDNSLFDLA